MRFNFLQVLIQVDIMDKYLIKKQPEASVAGASPTPSTVEKPVPSTSISSLIGASTSTSTATSASSPNIDFINDLPQSLLNTKVPFTKSEFNRIILESYPKSSGNRSFQSRWFQLFRWLEYDSEKDVVIAIHVVFTA